MLKEKLIAKAEELGWKVQIDEQMDGVDVNFYKYSPMGEDFGFNIYADSIEDVPDEVGKYYTYFDTEEHVEMWIEARRNGMRGVPSIKELVEDADAIDDMLDKLSDALYEVYNESLG